MVYEILHIFRKHEVIILSFCYSLEISFQLFPTKFDAVLKEALKLSCFPFLTYLTQLYDRQAKTNCPFTLMKETDFSFPVLSIRS